MPTEILTLEITDLARGGAGVARDEGGRIIFIPLTAPGDRVEIEVIEQKKRYAQGRLIKILQPSGLRITPRCPVFGRCGGCQWQHLPYDLQWKTKLTGAQHAIRRVNLPTPDPWDELPAEVVWNYRNRIQLRGESDLFGFYAAGSHDRVDIDRCDIARPEINAALDETRLEGRSLHRPYKVEIEVLPDGKIQKAWNSKHAAQGFRQIHDEQNEKLRSWVKKQLSPQGAARDRTLLDLYGGAGNLSLSLAPLMSEVHCVDLGVPRHAPPGTPANFKFHRALSHLWLEGNSQELKGRRVSVILDPPREGLGGDFGSIADSLAQIRAEEIVVIGCDPDSWARDVSRFVKKGWKLRSAATLDLFPQTPHVESLAYFTLGL